MHYSILYVGMRWDYGDCARGESFEHWNFHETLRTFCLKQGWRFIHYDFMQRGRDIGIEAMTEELFELCRKEHPDVLFSVLFDQGWDPNLGIFREISRLGTTTINWFCDDHWRFEGYSRRVAEYFDRVCTTAASALPKYADAGLSHKVIRSQWACNHELYKPLELSRDIDISFIGMNHGNREDCLARLHQAGLPVQIFGYGWPDCPRISFTQMIETFSRSKINLNLSNSSTMTGQQIKGRNFEVPGSRGFLLTDPAEDLENYFLDGREIVIYHNEDDLIEKARFYLSHPEERERIAQAGYERVLKEHTWHHRFGQIFRNIGLLQGDAALKPNAILFSQIEQLTSELQSKQQELEEKKYILQAKEHELEAFRTSKLIRLKNTLFHERNSFRKIVKLTYLTGALLTPRPLKEQLNPILQKARKRFQNPIRILTQKAWPADAPLVSVIIPCFNYGAYVEDAIDSVLAQSIQDFEILVIDGGSGPETIETLRCLSKPKTQIYFRDGRHLVGDNRNFGIDRARGKYVCCLDADDKLKPTYLEKALFLLETGGYDLVSTSVQCFGNSNEFWPIAKRPALDQVIEANHFSTVAVFSREFWKKAGGYHDFGLGKEHVPEDWELWVRMMALGARVINIEEPLMLYRTHPQPSLSNHPENPDVNVQRQRIKDYDRRLLSERAIVRSAEKNRQQIHVRQALLNLVRSFPQESRTRRSILFALPFLISGGADTVLLQIARHLVDQGFDVYVVTTMHADPEFGDNTPKYEEIASGVYHLTMFLEPEHWKDFIFYLIESRKIDLLLLVGSSYFYGILPEIKAKFPALRIVDQLYNEYGHIENNRKYASWIDLNIVENERVQGCLLTQYGESADRVHLIHNGVNIDYFVPEKVDKAQLLSEHSIPPDAFVVSFLGRFSEEKGPDLFVQIALRLQQEPEVFFVMGGCGPKVEQIQGMIQALGLSTKIYVPGLVDARAFLAISDLLVLPSRIDGRPNIVLESLSMGVPVVASAVGGLPAIIREEENGFLCEIGAVEKFEQCIRQLLANRAQHQRMCEQAREYAVKNLDVAVMLRRYSNLFRSLLGMEEERLVPQEIPREGILAFLYQAGLWQPGKSLKLHLGCGEQRFDGYVNIDYPSSKHSVQRPVADFFADITQLDFPDGSVDEIRLHHVFEHFNRSVALALLIRWHRWLKLKGKLWIETPDALGCAKQIASDLDYPTKQAILRHAFGSHEADWAYHLDGWYEEKFQMVLRPLGFEAVCRSWHWEQKPFLSNVEVQAEKVHSLELSQLLSEGEKLLLDSMVADVPSERSMHQVWCHMMQDALQKPAPVGTVLALNVLPDSEATTGIGYNNDDAATNGEFDLLTKLLSSGSVVFDVGANKGFWSKHVLEMYPGARLYAFEPVPLTFETLQRNLDGRARSFNLAVAQEDGMRTFFFYENSSEYAEMSTFFRRQAVEERLQLKPSPTQVEARSLDSFCRENAIERIDFLKIDTEGAELEVLRGAAELLCQHRIHYLQIEYGGTYEDAGTTLKDVFHLLSEHGYELYRLVTGGVIHLPVWRDTLENYQYSNFFAVYTE